jgi:uncharacterized protein (DUF427 family)
MRHDRIEPGPGQESVWDYPRPPAIVAFDGEVRIVHDGATLAATRRAIRILETSQPPAFYLPPDDVATDRLVESSNRSICEWKGVARYWSLRTDNGVIDDIAWSYPQPTAAFEPIRGYLAFYAQKLDECWVDDEQVQPNPGMFYGGWITSRVVGPFKGGPGTLGW